MGKVEIIMRCEAHNEVLETVLAAFEEHSPISTSPTLTFPGLTIQINTGTVIRDGHPVQLNYSEFSTLRHLAQHPGIIFSKEQLYTAIYGEDHFSSNTVPNTICRLRRKIEVNPRNPVYIKTVIGMGYKFEGPKE